MDNELQLFRYIDDDMDQDERRVFEQRLAASPELREELEQVRAALGKASQLLAVQPDTHYFESIVPRFRELLEDEPRQRFSLKAAYMLGPALLIILSLIITFPGVHEMTGEEQYAALLGDTGAAEYVDVLDFDYDDLYLTAEAEGETLQMVSEELYGSIEVTEEAADYYFGYVSGDDTGLLQAVTEEDLEQIYNSVAASMPADNRM